MIYFVCFTSYVNFFVYVPKVTRAQIFLKYSFYYRQLLDIFSCRIEVAVDK